MGRLIKKHADKFRFGIVGVANTAIDFGILFSLVALGLPAIVSNFISTSVALVFSFFANKKFTFRHSNKTSARHFATFLVITLFGLWVIQPIIILGVQSFVHGFSKSLILFIGKLLATIASLIWNYLMYRKFVFTNDKA